MIQLEVDEYSSTDNGWNVAVSCEGIELVDQFVSRAEMLKHLESDKHDMIEVQECVVDAQGERDWRYKDITLDEWIEGNQDEIQYALFKIINRREERHDPSPQKPLPQLTALNSLIKAARK